MAEVFHGTGEPVDGLVLCKCGCGEPVNLQHLAALRLRKAGHTPHEIAESLGLSRDTTKRLLAQAWSRSWNPYLRGHQNRVYTKVRKPTPVASRRRKRQRLGRAPKRPKERVQPKLTRPPTLTREDGHAWAAQGFQNIGGVDFRIDVCRDEGCRLRRAVRPSIR